MPQAVHATDMIHDEWQQYLSTVTPRSDGPGVAYVPDLRAVRFAGADARTFLQGYLTCDTDALRAGELTPTALCNLKGRVVMNGWCTLDGDTPETPADVLLILHASLVARLAEFLEAYLKFARATLTDLSDTTLVFAGLDLGDDADGLRLDRRRCLYLSSDLEQARSLWARYPHLTADAWLAALAADGIPLVSAAVSEKFLPQMLDLQTLGAINFDKGCYLGQEVVARAQHRGQVKRHLARLQWQGPAPPGPGGDICDAQGRSFGTVVQSAMAATGTGPLLAVLGRDAPHVLRQGDADLSPAT